MDQVRKKTKRALFTSELAACFSFLAVCAAGYMINTANENERKLAQKQEDLDNRAEWMIRLHVASEIMTSDRLTRTGFERSRAALVEANDLVPVEVPKFEQDWIHLPFPPVTKEQWEATTKAMIAEGYPAESIPEFQQ